MMKANVLSAQISQEVKITNVKLYIYYIITPITLLAKR